MRPSPALLKRSVWKGPNIIPRLAPVPRRTQPLPPTATTPSSSPSPSSPSSSTTTTPNTPGTSRIIYTKARAATILPSFVGLRFGVHNGKAYDVVLITEDMVNRKLGEFAFTRKRFTFKEGKGR